jgi:hypothetical protein
LLDIHPELWRALSTLPLARTTKVLPTSAPRVGPPACCRKSCNAPPRPNTKLPAKAGAIGGGGRWTPFRDTCEQLRAVVASAPGITLKEGIAAIRHHYTSMASARGALAARIESGLVPGVRLERDGKAVRLYPVVR